MVVSSARVDMSKQTFWSLKIRPPYQLKMLGISDAVPYPEEYRSEGTPQFYS
jgi:hypothetical protein